MDKWLDGPEAFLIKNTHQDHSVLLMAAKMAMYKPYKGRTTSASSFAGTHNKTKKKKKRKAQRQARRANR